MLSTIEILNRNMPSRNRRGMLGIRERRVIQVQYARMIQAYITVLRKRTISSIRRTRNGEVGSLVLDMRADDFAATFRNLRAFYANTPDQVTQIVRTFTNEANDRNKQQFYKGLERSFGVDLSNVIAEEGLQEILAAATEENVSLIKSIPSKYFDQVEQAVYRNIAGGGSTTGLEAELQRIGSVTKQRARVIARDQNSKLNNRLTQERQINIGIKKYVWVTVGDGDRVRPTHRANNGKTFRWDQPPAETGHPGEDVQCRCIAQPVIDF